MRRRAMIPCRMAFLSLDGTGNAINTIDFWHSKAWPLNGTMSVLIALELDEADRLRGSSSPAIAMLNPDGVSCGRAELTVQVTADWNPAARPVSYAAISLPMIFEGPGEHELVFFSPDGRILGSFQMPVIQG